MPIFTHNSETQSVNANYMQIECQSTGTLDACAHGRVVNKKAKKKPKKKPKKANKVGLSRGKSLGLASQLIHLIKILALWPQQFCGNQIGPYFFRVAGPAFYVCMYIVRITSVWSAQLIPAHPFVSRGDGPQQTEASDK